MRTLELLWNYREPLLSGISVTVMLSLMSMATAIFTGMLLCLLTLTRFRLIRLPAFFVVEFCRNTPILVSLIWVYYAVPYIIGIKFSAFTSSFIALAMQSSGYLAEEYRAGIESIEKGQVEAAQSLGMTNWRMMRRIVLPQAVLRMTPGILNQFVTCFKSTSVVSIIAVPDLMYQAGLIVNATYVAMPVYTFTALVYFALVLAISYLVRAGVARLPSTGRSWQPHYA